MQTETLKRIFEAVVGKREYPLESSATSAMPHTAFEDDAVLVLHGRDLSAGGVCILDRVGGYGEYPSSAEQRRGNNNADANGGHGGGGESQREAGEQGFEVHVCLLEGGWAACVAGLTGRRVEHAKTVTNDRREAPGVTHSSCEERRFGTMLATVAGIAGQSGWPPICANASAWRDLWRVIWTPCGCCGLCSTTCRVHRKASRAWN